MHLERSRFTEHRKALYFSERGRLGAVARRQKAFIDFIPQVEEHVDGLWSIWWGTLEGRGGNPLKMTLSTVSWRVHNLGERWGKELSARERTYVEEGYLRLGEGAIKVM